MQRFESQVKYIAPDSAHLRERGGDASELDRIPVELRELVAPMIESYNW
jgi:hypothetical protein